MEHTVHHSEAELDRRARTGEMDDHLAACPVCHARYTFLVRFHTALAEEMSRPTDPRIDRIAGGTARGNVIELRPAHEHPDLTSFGVTGGVVVLAAQSGRSAERGGAVISTFVAEQEHIVVRVVRDAQVDAFRVFLLTSDPRDASDVVLSIRSADGKQFEALTDESGTAVLRTPPEFPWETAVIAIDPRRR